MCAQSNELVLEANCTGSKSGETSVSTERNSVLIARRHNKIILLLHDFIELSSYQCFVSATIQDSVIGSMESASKGESTHSVAPKVISTPSSIRMNRCTIDQSYRI